MLAQLGSNRLGCFNSLAGLSVLGLLLLLLLLLLGCLNLPSRLSLRIALLRLRPIETVQVRPDSSHAQRLAPDELIAEVNCFLQLAQGEALLRNGLCHTVAVSAESEGIRRCLPLCCFKGR